MQDARVTGGAEIHPARPLAGIRAPVVGIGLAVAFMLLALVTYHSALQIPLSSDARFLSYQNEFMRDPGGLAPIWTADFFEGAITHGVPYRSGYYRPITNLFFWLEYRLSGAQDLLYHLSQILIHGFNGFLVFFLCFRLSGNRLAAGVAGLMFVLHPVQAFAASEPAARADVLFPVFYILALVVFDSALRGVPGRGAMWKVGLTVALYLLAVLSKEMGITLPAVLVLLVLYRHFQNGVRLRALTWTIPVWLAFAAYLVWRFVIIRLPTPTVGYGDEYATHVLVLGSLKGILIHISRIVLPLGADYPELHPTLINYVGSPRTDPLTYFAIAIVLSIAAIACLWKWNPLVAFWSGFFLVTFSPLLRVDNIAGTIGHNVLLTQERWIYLPSIAVAALVGEGVSRLASTHYRRLPRAVLASAVVVVLLLLARSAAVHAGRHEDPFARLRFLYLMPEENLSRMQQANKLLLYAQWVAEPMGNLDEAEERAREAVRLVPDSPISAAALAEVLSQSGKWHEIIDVLDPWLDPSLEELQRYTETNFRVADDLNRVNPIVPFLLAQAHAHLGDEARASDLLCDAARRDFDHVQVAEAFREWTPSYDGTTCRAWTKATP